eukprot:gene7554-11877_t
MSYQPQQTSLTTRFYDWWNKFPLYTRIILCSCVGLYIVGLLSGWPSTSNICFSPLSVIKFPSRFYTIFTHPFFHLGILHIVFNMMAALSFGVGLENRLGTTELFLSLLALILLATSLELLIVALFVYIPSLSSFVVNTFGRSLFNQIVYTCGAGFSGILFAYMAISNKVFQVERESVFGLFSIPAAIYPWLLLILLQFIFPNVSLMGHLSGLIAGYIYAYGFLGRKWWGVVLSKAETIVPTKIRHLEYFITKNPELSDESIWNSFRFSSSNPEQTTTPQGEQLEFSETLSFPGSGRVLGPPPDR